MAAPLNTCTTIEQRGVVRFLWAKNMEAKDIHKEMLPVGQHFFVDILYCIHIFFSLKTQNATLFYRGTCIQGAPPSCNSCYVCTVMRIPIDVCHNKTG
jgi:hypothetical protein